MIAMKLSRQIVLHSWKICNDVTMSIRCHRPRVFSLLPSKECIEWEVGHGNAVEELDNPRKHKEHQEGINGLETG